MLRQIASRLALVALIAAIGAMTVSALPAFDDARLTHAADGRRSTPAGSSVTTRVAAQPVSFSGFVDDSNPLAVRFDWSGIEIRTQVTGVTSLSVLLADSGNQYNVLVNNLNVSRINTQATASPVAYLAVNQLNPAQTYAIRIQKRTEASDGIATFTGFVLQNDLDDSEPQLLPYKAVNTRKLVFYGDSITCGYGIDGNTPCPWSYDTQDVYATYEGVISREFNADVYIQAWSGRGVIRNYGEEGFYSANGTVPSYLLQSVANDPTSTWNFTRFTPDAVVINLGTNDVSDPVYRPPDGSFLAAYTNYIAKIRDVFNAPKLPVFLVCGPMASGTICIDVLTLVETGDNLYYIDMENIMSPADYGCNGHPNISGHGKMALVAIAKMSVVMNW
ncbi:hypothetical protein CAOG_03151 [Capsaspora owczarzaki ATCC 30864]|uniref:Endoglucanase E n=1 Tax=Capsaspora owczarzaki (strain ATCC 30864) TaxID=595528 RepID=A0A0D2WNV0_CAPO3|nr:hypothetical protein CAOG_03151 [Capsaspora owczarzaki ATCC 30864]KJE92133.1 hypothetical protein CAOG_003151 [Capsaspora owczarzaki ATCC 30864]|eukprot:XP_004363990.1 hypothetical protein CAOG_03151 [Capsaspora owczarzaki ATCC 30864]